MAPDRKALAEAGRKKLEEFRKAKAQGKSPVKSTGADGAELITAADTIRAAPVTPIPASNGVLHAGNGSHAHAAAAPLSMPVPATPTTAPAPSSFVVVAEGSIPFMPTPGKDYGSAFGGSTIQVTEPAPATAGYDSYAPTSSSYTWAMSGTPDAAAASFYDSTAVNGTAARNTFSTDASAHVDTPAYSVPGTAVDTFTQQQGDISNAYSGYGPDASFASAAPSYPWSTPAVNSSTSFFGTAHAADAVPSTTQPAAPTTWGSSAYNTTSGYGDNSYQASGHAGYGQNTTTAGVHETPSAAAAAPSWLAPATNTSSALTAAATTANSVASAYAALSDTYLGNSTAHPSVPEAAATQPPPQAPEASDSSAPATWGASGYGSSTYGSAGYGHGSTAYGGTTHDRGTYDNTVHTSPAQTWGTAAGTTSYMAPEAPYLEPAAQPAATSWVTAATGPFGSSGGAAAAAEDVNFFQQPTESQPQPTSPATVLAAGPALGAPVVDAASSWFDTRPSMHDEHGAVEPVPWQSVSHNGVGAEGLEQSRTSYGTATTMPWDAPTPASTGTEVLASAVPAALLFEHPAHPSATETAYAMGAGAAVAGVTDPTPSCTPHADSTEPEPAPATSPVSAAFPPPPPPPPPAVPSWLPASMGYSALSDRYLQPPAASATPPPAPPTFFTPKPAARSSTNLYAAAYQQHKSAATMEQEQATSTGVSAGAAAAVPAADLPAASDSASNFPWMAKPVEPVPYSPPSTSDTAGAVGYAAWTPAASSSNTTSAANAVADVFAGYAALSDSYLSPSKPAAQHATESEQGTSTSVAAATEPVQQADVMLPALPLSTNAVSATPARAAGASMPHDEHAAAASATGSPCKDSQQQVAPEPSLVDAFSQFLNDDKPPPPSQPKASKPSRFGWLFGKSKQQQQEQQDAPHSPGAQPSGFADAQQPASESVLLEPRFDEQAPALPGDGPADSLPAAAQPVAPAEVAAVEQASSQEGMAAHDSYADWNKRTITLNGWRTSQGADEAVDTQQEDRANGAAEPSAAPDSAASVPAPVVNPGTWSYGSGASSTTGVPAASLQGDASSDARKSDPIAAAPRQPPPLSSSWLSNLAQSPTAPTADAMATGGTSSVAPSRPESAPSMLSWLTGTPTSTLATAPIPPSTWDAQGSSTRAAESGLAELSLNPPKALESVGEPEPEPTQPAAPAPVSTSSVLPFSAGWDSWNASAAGATSAASAAAPTETASAASTSTPSDVHAPIPPPASTSVAAPSYLSALPTTWPLASTAPYGTAAARVPTSSTLGPPAATQEVQAVPPMAPSSSSHAASATAGATQLSALGGSTRPATPSNGGASHTVSLPAPLSTASRPWLSHSNASGYTSTSDYFLTSSIYSSAAASKGLPASGMASRPPLPLPPTSGGQPSFLESYLDNLLGTRPLSRAASGKACVSSQAESMDGDGLDTSVSGRPSQAGNAERPVPAVAVEEQDVQVPAAGEAVGHDASRASLEAPALAHGGRVQPSTHGLPHTISTASLSSMAAAGGGPTPAQQARFAALQQHIDELTSEKLELARGLAKQGQLAAELSEENAALAERLNTRGKAVEAMTKKLEQYEGELAAQALAMEAMAAEREAAKVAMQEAASRATGLASEVVGLEAALLQAKSTALKLDKALQERSGSAGKLERALEKAKAEAARSSEEAAKLAQEKRALFVRLKQTEARLSKVLDETGASSRAREALMSGMTPVALPSADIEVQCDLMVPSVLEALEAQLHEAVAAANAASADAEAARDVARAAEEAAAARDAALQEQAEALQQARAAAAAAGSAVPAPAATSPTRGADLALVGSLLGGNGGGSDPASAIIAERALASLPGLTASSTGGVAGPLAPTASAVAGLAKWLPRGPVSCVSSVSAIAEEEVRLVGAIHALLSEYELAHTAVMADLRRAQATNNDLRASNTELRHKLELSTQRLELALSQGAGMAAVISMGHQHQAGLLSHQQPSPGAASATSSMGAYSAYNASTVYAHGSSVHHGAHGEHSSSAGAEQHTSYGDPTSPLPGSYLPPNAAGPGQHHRQPQSLDALLGEAGGLSDMGVRDPVVAEATRAAMLGAALTAKPPGRTGGWLGMLFARPQRPKKRIRNALV